MNMGIRSGVIVVRVIPIFSLLFLHPSPVHATGVKFFTGATVQRYNAAGQPFGGPISLPLAATAAVSILSRGSATLTVSGAAVGGAGAAVSTQLIDEDYIDDDELDSHNANADAAGKFTITLHLQCSVDNILLGGWELVGDNPLSSGEQTTEIAVEDGSQHIPAGTTWHIACDKATAAFIATTATNVYFPWAEGTATVRFPSGALSEDTLIHFSNALPIKNPTSVPTSFLPISEALSMEPYSLELFEPANVTLPYSDGEIEGYYEMKLQVLQFDDASGSWQVIPSTTDTVRNALNFHINSLGSYGFAGPASFFAVFLPIVTKN